MALENSFISSGKIMILDDHELFGQSLQLMLEQMLSGFQVNYFKNVGDAQNELYLDKYRFLLVDLIIPGENVKDFILFCKESFPELIILIVSSVIDLKVIKTYMEMGVDAYLSKATSQNELKMALEKTYAGKKFISSDLSAGLIANHSIQQEDYLTSKELEILKLIAAGYNVRKTAEVMNISPYTVMAHRRNIMKKLSLHSAPELVRYAFENNLT